MKFEWEKATNIIKGFFLNNKLEVIKVIIYNMKQ